MIAPGETRITAAGRIDGRPIEVSIIVPTEQVRAATLGLTEGTPVLAVTRTEHGPLT